MHKKKHYNNKKNIATISSEETKMNNKSLLLDMSPLIAQSLESWKQPRCRSGYEKIRRTRKEKKKEEKKSIDVRPQSQHMNQHTNTHTFDHSYAYHHAERTCNEHRHPHWSHAFIQKKVSRKEKKQRHTPWVCFQKCKPRAVWWEQKQVKSVVIKRGKLSLYPNIDWPNNKLKRSE